jgi:hypothetical protein
MKEFQKYIQYIKDNPKDYWFKRKLYGWGWIPVKWQGWLVIFVFIALIICFATNLGEYPTSNDLDWYFVKIGLSILFLIAICYKTGEKPKWQWGIDKKDK